MPNGDVWNRLLASAAGRTPLYSNADRTAAAPLSLLGNATSYVQNVTPQITGRWYAELTVQYTGPADDRFRVGVVGDDSPAHATTLPPIPIRPILGADPHSLGWAARGDVTIAQFVSIATPYAAGAVLGIAADFDLGRVWLRVNQGAWGDQRNTATAISVADPVSQIGGIDISGFGQNWKFIGVTLPPHSTVTIAALTALPPSGFQSWLNPPGLLQASGAAVLGLPRATGLARTGRYIAHSNPQAGVLGRPVAQAAAAVFNPRDVRLPIDRSGAQARVNIFDVPIVVHLTLTQSRIGNPVRMNYPVNRTDFNLIRGVPNVIQFFVRDVDRHIASGPLANASLTVSLVDTSAEKLLAIYPLTAIDAATSLYAMFTQPVELQDWPSGPLRYSVQVSRADGTTSLLWTDRHYTPYGHCRLIDGPLPGPAQPIRLDPAAFISRDGISYSSPVSGAAGLGYLDGVQTFSFSTTNFTGNVAIQASLVGQPSSEAQNWFEIQQQAFSRANGVTAVNVVGNYLWLRVAVPTLNPLPFPGIPLLPPPNGSVDLVLYLA